jgi:heptosyltransferase III
MLSEQIGDVIACEPVARVVRKRHPDGHILWIIKGAYSELVENHPDLDGCLPEICPGERVKLQKSGIFDFVYNLHLSHRECRFCKEESINPIAEKLGLTYDNYYCHGDLLHTFSQAAGLPALSADPKMYIPDPVRERVKSLGLPKDPIVIHCLSSHYMRDWPAENWNRLVEWLIANYPNPIIEVGLNSIVSVEHPQLRSLCGKLSLLETAEVIGRSRLFIGNDSGPAHMANAMGANAILLFGKFLDFVDYLPYSGRYKRGEGVRILNRLGHPCAELPYKWVQGAVRQELDRTRQYELVG